MLVGSCQFLTFLPKYTAESRLLDFRLPPLGEKAPGQQSPHKRRQIGIEQNLDKFLPQQQSLHSPLRSRRYYFQYCLCPSHRRFLQEHNFLPLIHLPHRNLKRFRRNQFQSVPEALRLSESLFCFQIHYLCQKLMILFSQKHQHSS